MVRRLAVVPKLRGALLRSGNYHRCDERLISRLMGVSYTDSRAYAWSVVHTLDRPDAVACAPTPQNARGSGCC